MTIRRGIERGTLAGALIALVACNPGEGKLAFVGAEVFDGTGTPLILDAVIIVADGRIEAIGPPDLVAIPRGAAEVRLDGQWVVPGLIDAHTHAARWTADRFVAYGVTSIRDVGGQKERVFALRDELNRGSVTGPRMYASGAMLDGAPATWPEANALATGAAARQAIDQLVLLDAQQAKIYTGIDQGLLRPLMDEATTLGLPVTGHLGKVDALTAARLGVGALEHMTGVVEASVADPARLYRAHEAFFAGWNAVERAWGGLDSARLARTADALVAANVTIVPTLALREALTHLTDSAYIARLDLRGVPDSVRAAWNVPDLVRRSGLTGDELAAARRARPVQDRFIRLYKRAGGLVAVGSDTPNQLLAPGASLHDELALLVAAGFTPREALLAATRDNARLIGADSIGRLVPGAVADFVVLGGNPLDDIAHTRQIELVVARGTMHRPADLQRGW